MKKVLFIANIHKHIRAFHLPYIEFLQSKGFEVHVAANDKETKITEADKQFVLPIKRNPFNLSNIKAIRSLKKIIEKEKYELIHCHTAMGSVTARLAARTFRAKNKLKVIYTVHGFHFFKNSPKKYWLIYYPVEKYLSKFTDAIVTINEEDFELIKRQNFKNSYTFKIPGIGINDTKFNEISNTTISAIRKENVYNDNQFLIIYVAEFIHRKNHKFIIDSIDLIKDKIENFKFLFAGRGVLKEEIQSMVSVRNLNKYVDFLGFRTDIGNVIFMADIGVSVSNQEGLPMNIAEEMYASKPVVATKTRGHIDLIEHNKTGYLFEKGNKQEFANFIINLYNNPKHRLEMGYQAKLKSKNFELKNCINEMEHIYKKFLVF